MGKYKVQLPFRVISDKNNRLIDADSVIIKGNHSSPGREEARPEEKLNTRVKVQHWFKKRWYRVNEDKLKEALNTKTTVNKKRENNDLLSARAYLLD